MKKRWITGTRCLGLGLGALAFLAAGCASNGDDGKDGADATNLPFFLGLSVAPPSGPAGQYTVDASGGAGTAGSGGSGGDMSVGLSYGSLGGNVLVFATGVADAGFDLPEVTTYLGANGLEVAEDLTIAVVDEEPAEGTPYLVDSSSLLYVSDGDGALADEDPVTGLGVDAGVTVTVEPNNYGQAWISVEYDVVNAGTLTTPLADGDRAGLRLSCDTFYGTAGSKIDLTGAAGDEESSGGAGGDLYVGANGEGSKYGLAVGVIVNRGEIDTSGGDGTAGGNAGTIMLDAHLWAANTGTLTARGGAGSVRGGGSAGYVSIRTDYGNNFNAGVLDASGGDGATSGGSGGTIELSVEHPGDLRNAGDLTADGGDVTDAACTGEVTCRGGSGGYLRLQVYGGGIANAADLAARGGAGTTGDGGNGGSVAVTAEKSDDFFEGWAGEYQPLGDIAFSGNVDLGGGGGASGGDGGRLNIALDAEYVPALQQVVLYGYTGIVLDGGNGAAAGGPAGDYACYTDYSYDDGPFEYGPSGGVVNHADVSARGGTGATGGSGGDVEFRTDDYYGYTTVAELAYNYGDLDLRGGTGTLYGGDGGDLYVWGYNAAGNEGGVDTSGGDATGDAAEEAMPRAGHAGGVEIYSDLGEVRNAGTIAADGGDATGSGDTHGGDGAKVELVGASLRNTAPLSAAGGDGATGGNGAMVFLYGVFDGSTLSGGVTVDGGAGTTAGYDGSVWIDGIDATDQYVDEPTGPPPADG